MNNIDYIILGVVFVSTIISLLRGFFKESISLAVWIIGLWVAMKFYTPFSNVFARYSSKKTTRLGVAIGDLIRLVPHYAFRADTDRVQIGMMFCCIVAAWRVPAAEVSVDSFSAGDGCAPALIGGIKGEPSLDSSYYCMSCGALGERPGRFYSSVAERSTTPGSVRSLASSFFLRRRALFSSAFRFFSISRCRLR